MNETGLRITAFINSAERFIKRYGADVCAVLAGGFTVAAGVSAFTAGKKIGSKEALRRAEDAHTETGQTDNSSGESNAKLLVQPVVFGTIAVGSIALSRILGRKREESLLAACSVLALYARRKEQISGIEHEINTCEPRRNRRDDKANSIESTGTGDLLFIEDLTGRRFTASVEHVTECISQLQDEFERHNFVPLNSFYAYLGLQPTSAGDILGWSVNQSILDPYLNDEDYDDMKYALTDLGIMVRYYEGLGYVIHYPVMPVGGLAGVGPCNY